jgi:flagellar biosynthetic protein FliR
MQLANLVALGDDLFILALKVAVPLVAFLLLTDLSLGIIARVMPQMNVFIVGIPLKIAMGLLFLSLVVLQFDPVVRQTTNTFINDAGALLTALGGG